MQLTKLISKINSLSKVEKEIFLSSLSKAQLIALYQFPDLFLFPKQIIPDTVLSRYIILRCGRRFGKTVSGSAWLAKRIKAGAKSIGLAGAKHEDVFKIMVPNLLNWFDPITRSKIKINEQKHQITFPTCICHTYTSDAENRGSSLEYLWCDELGSWCQSIDEKVKERFQIIDTAVSVGPNPQTIITSTPKSFSLYREIQREIDASNPDYYLITGNMNDNPYLSEEYRRIEKKKYANNAFGRQEYFGELITDNPNALWSYDLLAKCQEPSARSLLLANGVPSQQFYEETGRTVIAIDPSMSMTGDETGIIVATIWKDKVLIVKDASGTYSPNEWANIANNLAYIYKADRIVAEKNQGGDLVAANLRNVNPNLPISTIHAKKGKMTRAEPVAALYEQNKVIHLNSFPKLEQQMVEYSGAGGKSPDRMDALVYAVSELALQPIDNQHRGGVVNTIYW